MSYFKFVRIGENRLFPANKEKEIDANKAVPGKQ